MTEREALKLALEALVFNQANWQGKDKAITAIKEALAQPEQDWIEQERAVGYREGHRAALAQRTWVGLTDEEVKNFVQAVWPREATATDYIRAIEAKLKEKNYG